MTTANPPASILVVDDTPANLNVLSTLLSQQGYKVRPANSGEAALLVAQNALPDLVLLDIQMPGLSGFEVCRRLKNLETTRAIPIIFISALDEALDKVEAFQIGGADYITKPFQILEVLARVEHQLALGRLRRQIEAASASGTQLHIQAARLSNVMAVLQQEVPIHSAALAELTTIAQAVAAIADELRRTLPRQASAGDQL